MATIQLTPGTSFALIPDNQQTFTFLGTGGNVVMTANTAVLAIQAPVSLAGLGVSNVNTSTSTNGFSFNVNTNRTQVASRGFTFNQDGDVLTPTNKTRYVYTYTGADQTFVVPTGVSWIYAKLWGAGGGAGRSGSWAYGSDGGGGGHTRALIPVTPGATIYVKVGSGGYTTSGLTTVYGGGGTGASAAGDNQYSGMGGGFCGIFNGSVTFANALAIAGGGGGGGVLTGQFAGMAIGGAGGGSIGQRGLSGQQATFANGGGGGTTNAGGAAGVGNSNGANAGTQLTGGNSGTNNYGGGGGGGYYGGGAGAYTNGNIMGGGGGGAGYYGSTARFGATYTGQYRTPAMYWDNDLVVGNNNSLIEMLAYGGQNSQNNVGAGTLSGGHAYAVIYY